MRFYQRIPKIVQYSTFASPKPLRYSTPEGVLMKTILDNKNLITTIKECFVKLNVDGNQQGAPCHE